MIHNLHHKWVKHANEMQQKIYSWNLFPRKLVSVFHKFGGKYQSWMHKIQIYICVFIVLALQPCYVTKDQQGFHSWSHPEYFTLPFIPKFLSHTKGTIINCTGLHRTTYPYPFTWSTPLPTSFSPSPPYCSHPLCFLLKKKKKPLALSLHHSIFSLFAATTSLLPSQSDDV